LVTLIADLLVVFPAPSPLRDAFAVVFVCVLPGAAILAIGILPGRDLRHWEFAFWAVALSLASVPLLGLALNLSPAGLTRGAWLVGLNIIVLPGLAVLALRRRPVALDLPRVDRQMFLRASALSLAAALAATALVLRVRNADTAATSQPVIALWAVPSSTDVALGVDSTTPSLYAYRLVVSLQPGETRAFHFTLGDAQKWRTRLSLSRSQLSSGVVVQARLFREGRPKPLRLVRLRVGPPKR
jgi:hypothetical protein